MLPKADLQLPGTAYLQSHPRTTLGPTPTWHSTASISTAPACCARVRVRAHVLGFGRQGSVVRVRSSGFGRQGPTRRPKQGGRVGPRPHYYRSSATAALPQHCRSTATGLPQQRYRRSTATGLLQQRYRSIAPAASFSSATAAALLQHRSRSIATAAALPQHRYCSIATAASLPQHRYRSIAENLALIMSGSPSDWAWLL